MCSSPQLIAAYHVLLRLLEPRHPPCALIRFKTIQIFTCLTTLLGPINRSDKSYSVSYNFFSQYVKELWPVARPLHCWRFVNVPDLNRMTCQPSHIVMSKELLAFSASDRQRSSAGPMSLNELRSFGRWRMSESNRRPPACKAGALAN